MELLHNSPREVEDNTEDDAILDSNLQDKAEQGLATTPTASVVFRIITLYNYF